VILDGSDTANDDSDIIEFSAESEEVPSFLGGFGEGTECRFVVCDVESTTSDHLRGLDRVALGFHRNFQHLVIVEVIPKSIRTQYN